MNSPYQPLTYSNMHLLKYVRAVEAILEIKITQDRITMWYELLDCKNSNASPEECAKLVQRLVG